MSNKANILNLDYSLPTSDGSSGQVLQTNGSGTVSWATPSGGAGSFVHLDTQTAASVSTLTFSDITSTYNNYLLLGRNLIPSAAGIYLNIQVATSGPTWATNGYNGGLNYLVWNSTSSTNINTGSGFLALQAVASNYNSFNAQLTLTPGGYPMCFGEAQTSNTVQYTMGVYKTASTIVAIRTNIQGAHTFSGVISLYGYVE